MSENITDAEVKKLKQLNQKDETQLSDKEVTSKIKLSVKRKFDFPTWMLVFEFQNRKQKRADCLAFNTVASRNFKLVGFEFKASRSDWLQEKRNHEKADLFVQQCDEWYVVAGRRDIVKEEELPQGWGLLELKPSGQLWNIIESDLSDTQDTELDRRFFVKFMKKAVGNESNFTQADIREAERRGYNKAKDEAVDRHLDRETKKLKERANSYEKLQESDLNLGYGELTDERIERLNKAQAIVQEIDGDNFGGLKHNIERLRKDAERHYDDVVESADELEEVLDSIRDDLVGDCDE